MASRKWRQSLTILRVLLSLLIVGQGMPVYGAGSASSPISVRVCTNSGIPSSVTDLNGQPDMVTQPPRSGRVMLQWSAPQSGDGSQVFSYVVKYATFPVTGDLLDDTTAWWNHPSALTVLDAQNNPKWGIFTTHLPGTLENLQITGLVPGQRYYFGVRSYDRYHQLANMDMNLASIVNQSSACASTIPYKAKAVDPLTCYADSEETQTVCMEWDVPHFMKYDEDAADYTGDYVATIGEGAQYCVQYSTEPPTGVTSIDNDWAANSIYVSTSNITSGDHQRMVVHGLTEDSVYYFLLFTKTDWVWSMASAVGTALPNQYVGSVVNLKAVDNGSNDPDVGSSIKLSWGNPVQPLLSGVKICYSTTGYPTSSSHNPSVVLPDQLSGASTDYTFTQLLPRTTYYFSVYAYDTMNTYSQGINVSTCTNKDYIAPESIKDVSGLIGPDEEGNLSIDLSWTTPDAAPLYRNSDYAGVELEISEVGVAGSTTTTIAGVNGQTQHYLHQNLNINTSYHYVLKGFDSVNNYSVAVDTVIYISEDYGKPNKPVITSAVADIEEDPASGCGVTLSWNAPASINLNNIRIVYSTASSPATIFDGTLVDSRTITAGDYQTILKQLEPNTTYYFALASVSDFGIVSDIVYQQVVTAIPWNDTVSPFLPLGIRADVLSATNVKVSWKPVRYNNDRQAFADKFNPNIKELYSYDVYRSTDLYADNWELCTSTRGTTCEYTNTIAANREYFYKIRARDISCNYRESLIADMHGGVIALNSDDSYVWLPVEALNDLNYMEINSNTDEEQGPVVRSIEWHAYDVIESSSCFELSTVSNFNAQRHVSAAPAVEQQNRSGELVMSAKSGNKALSKAFSYDQARLSIFYFNGAEWLKLNSTYDAADQSVKTPIKFAGKYQLRAAAPAEEFAFLGIMPRIVTPNNDGMNDRVLFRYANPNNSSVSIRIFDIRGALVRKVEQSTRTSDVQGEYVSWDATDGNGSIVQPGVYIYQIQGEGKLINGTIVVAR